jgi:hypothetical protein
VWNTTAFLQKTLPTTSFSLDTLQVGGQKGRRDVARRPPSSSYRRHHRPTIVDRPIVVVAAAAGRKKDLGGALKASFSLARSLARWEQKLSE